MKKALIILLSLLVLASFMGVIAVTAEQSAETAAAAVAALAAEKASEQETEKPAEAEKPAEEEKEEVFEEEIEELEEPEEEIEELDEETEEEIEELEEEEIEEEIEEEEIPEDENDEEPEEVKIVVYITGNHTTAKYDGNAHKAKGYEVKITCNGKNKSCGYKTEFISFDGGAEVQRTKLGKSVMNLNPSNTEADFDVTFEVTDGYVEILDADEDEEIIEDTKEEETKEEPEKPVEKPILVINMDLPEEEPVEKEEIVGETEGTVEEETTEETEETEEPVEEEIAEETEEPVEEEIAEETEEPVEEEIAEETEEPVEEETEEETEEPVEEEIAEETEEPVEEEIAEETEEPVEEEIAEETEEPVEEETDDEYEAITSDSEETEAAPILKSGTVLRIVDEETVESELTLDADTEFTVLEVTDEWVMIETADGLIAYIAPEDLPAEESEPTQEEALDAEIPEEETVQVLKSGTVLRVVDEESGESELILDADTEFTILEVTDEWVKIETADGLIAYIALADLPVSETSASTQSVEKLTITGPVYIREDADGMSSVIATVDENTEVIVLERTEDWILVKVGDVIGYIYRKDVETETEPQPAGKMKVDIFTDRHSQMSPGEKITLTSRLEGFEDYEIKYQWECDKGGGFKPVEGGDGASYSYEATIESLAWSFRLTVLYR